MIEPFYAFAESSRERPIHRVSGGVERTASVQRVFTDCGRFIEGVTSIHPPEMDPYECWVTGWRPCSVCFRSFDAATWRALRRREDAACEADGGNPEGRVYAAFYDGVWREIYRRRGAVG